MSEGRICGYAETDEDGAEDEPTEERGDPRSDLFSVFSALSAR
ncbi:MAG: hypothetical protein WA137_09735 [Methanothrix sp.]